MFLFTLTGVQVMFFFPFYSDEEQQDVDTQVLFEFAQELETRFVWWLFHFVLNFPYQDKQVAMRLKASISMWDC